MLYQSMLRDTQDKAQLCFQVGNHCTVFNSKTTWEQLCAAEASCYMGLLCITGVYMNGISNTTYCCSHRAIDVIMCLIISEKREVTQKDNYNDQGECSIFLKA